MTITGQLVSSLANGTAPISVTSTTVCPNLNADLHDGYHAGNSSGQIPISNGTLNTNLNAQYLNGNASSAFQPALGFTPVRQGGGAGQGSNILYMGWSGSQLLLQVDSTNFSNNWPISISGNAATLASKTWAAPDPLGATTPSTVRCTSLRIDQTPTTGSAAANNSTGGPALVSKPGSASDNTWLSVNLNGTTYYIPVWT